MEPENKKIMRKDYNMTSTITICSLYLLLSVVGMTFIKSGHDANSIISIPGTELSLSFRTIIGILFYGVSFLVFTFYVSRLNIGIVIPIVSGIFCLLITVIGVFVFKEKINIGQFAGIALIIAGTIIVGVFK